MEVEEDRVLVRGELQQRRPEERPAAEVERQPGLRPGEAPLLRRAPLLRQCGEVDLRERHRACRSDDRHPLPPIPSIGSPESRPQGLVTADDLRQA